MNRIDRASLWLLIPVFVIAVAEMTGVIRFEGLQAGILIAIGLTGSLHHILSFTAVMTIPDIRRLPSTSLRLSPAATAASFVILFIALTLLTGFIFRIFKFGGNIPYGYFLFGQYFVDGSIAFFHTTRQTTGLIRNGDFDSPAADRETVERTHKIEKVLVWVFVTLMSLSYIGIRSANKEVHWTAVAAMSAISIWWVVYVFRSPFRSREMRAFSLRILLWPFYSASLAVLSALKTFHALEYVQVFYKIQGNLPASNRKRFVVTTAIGMAIYFFVIAFNLRGVFYQLTGANLWQAAAEIILPLYLAMAIMHVVIDSIIFKMRRPEVREVMTRLLFTKKPIEGT